MNNRRRFIKKLADLLNVELNPVQQVHELEDKKGSIYLWQANCTAQQCLELSKRIKSEYRKNYNRNPDALHIVKNDIQNIDEVGIDKMREVVAPYIERVEADKQ